MKKGIVKASSTGFFKTLEKYVLRFLTLRLAHEKGLLSFKINKLAATMPQIPNETRKRDQVRDEISTMLQNIKNSVRVIF